MRAFTFKLQFESPHASSSLHRYCMLRVLNLIFSSHFELLDSGKQTLEIVTAPDDVKQTFEE